MTGFPFIDYIVALFLQMAEGQTLGGSPGWTERIILYTVLALSVTNNVLEFVKKRKAADDELSNSTISSYKNAYSAKELELSGATTKADGYKKELEVVSEEYETLAGIDMKYILDLAREGLHLELARQQREIVSLKRQLDWANAHKEPGSENEHERRKK